ncbi:MAG: MSHA biogenesis protein MshP [Burkholderiales bacterium]
MIAGQRGFGAIMAIVILVVMATLAAALVRLGTTQQATSTQDILSARAWQVARAGDEWGLYWAMHDGSCANAAGTLDLRASTGFAVTVSCTSKNFNEGESAPGTPRVITTYSIDAVACNSATCPNAGLAATPGYIERRRLVVANTP